MTNVSGLTQAQLDEHFLRHSFEVARRSMSNGNHPFGAILVDYARQVLIETENGFMPALSRASTSSSAGRHQRRGWPGPVSCKASPGH